MHGLQNVDFRAGYWLNAVPGQCYSLIACNPPYVACDDPHLETCHTNYEPQIALISGKGGMKALQQIISAAPFALAPGGWLVLEHGHQQEPAVDHLLYQARFESVVHYRDTSGKSRVSAARVSNSFADE